MGHFATGVTIVAGMEAGEPLGFTAQSFHSLSMDPPLILVCPSKTVSSWPRIRTAGKFCVSILGRDQEALCMTFASKTLDKFADAPWAPAPVTGSPMLDSAMAWIDCELDAEHDGGDHTVVVGRVVDVEINEDAPPPLLFYRAGFGRFES
ncbi:MAG: flavin reductase family protein [Actinobacteria bacterium]|nr:flavin reductase family protein [Actinomycetota bacterium]